MDFKRRFLFHGHSAAIGGRIVRRNNNKPVDVLLESTCESSLTPVGGHSKSTMEGRDYDGLVSFGSATTYAHGIFDDHKRAFEASRGELDEDALVATTRVGAEIHDVVIGLKPQLTVKLLRATLHSRSPFGSGQPSIKPLEAGKQTAIEGLFIDGHELLVELNTPIFRKCDTHAKLLTATDDPKFVKAHGHCLFMRSGVDNRRTPPSGRLVVSNHAIHSTIVGRLRWKGKPFPGAVIDHNSVKIPKFGQIFLGEMLIGERSRRLTMLRARLGSPIGGQIAFASAEPNGGWS